MNQTKSSTTHNSHMSEMIRSKSLAPGLTSTWTTCHSCYVISSVLEQPKDDDSEQDGSLTGSIAAKDPAASSLQVTKGPASKGPPETADRHRGQLSVAVCGHTSVHAAGVAGNPRTNWDIIEDEELPAAPRSTPKGTPSLRRGGPGHY